MITIKLQCRCGQKYSFDVEPIGGRMNRMVACPVCGADGTEVANIALAQMLSKPPPATRGVDPLPSAFPVQAEASVSTPAPGPPGAQNLPADLFLHVDRIGLEREARSRIKWGDPPGKVIKYLRVQGLSDEEANYLVDGLLVERVAVIRGFGVRKILVGTALASVPVIAYTIFMSMGDIPWKLFVPAIMVGLWGAWLLIRGIFMVVSPKTETGDLVR
jgi:hypothetical protein